MIKLLTIVRFDGEVAQPYVKTGKVGAGLILE